MKPLNIAILDDHQIIIDGLKLLLQNQPAINVVMEANSGKAFLDQLPLQWPPVDIVIMDLMMPEMNGYEVAMVLQEKYRLINIIMLTMNTQADLAYKLVESAAIKALLPKAINKYTLLEAIQQVASGATFFHKDILAELELYKIRVYEKGKLMLSPRELEIISLICRGMSSKDIAAQLYLSEHTVITHRKNISRKTGTGSPAALIEFAHRMKLIGDE